MARPNLMGQRRQQILDAFEVCVARYGVEGATLAKTAEQAGLARALIRHNLGNREDLVTALTDQFVSKSCASVNSLVASLPPNNRSRTLIDLLFDPVYSDPQMVRVANALIAASPETSALAKQMRGWLNGFIASVTQVIANEHRNASENDVSAVVAGITGIYFNVEALYPIGDISGLSKSSKRAALILIATLEDQV